MSTDLTARPVTPWNAAARLEEQRAAQARAAAEALAGLPTSKTGAGRTHDGRVSPLIRTPRARLESVFSSWRARTAMLVLALVAAVLGGVFLAVQLFSAGATEPLPACTPAPAVEQPAPQGATA